MLHVCYFFEQSFSLVLFDILTTIKKSSILEPVQIVENLLDRKLLAIPVNFDDADANKSDVTFKLFIKAEETKGRYLDETKVNKLVLNRNLPAKFFIHNFRSNSNVSWYGLLKTAYFRR